MAEQRAALESPAAARQTANRTGAIGAQCTESDLKESTMGTSTATLVAPSSATTPAWDAPVLSTPAHVELGSPATAPSTAPAPKAGKKAKNEMECFATDDPELILQARQLMAAVYLKRDFITQSELDHDGPLTEEKEPHATHS